MRAFAGVCVVVLCAIVGECGAQAQVDAPRLPDSVTSVVQRKLPLTMETMSAEEKAAYASWYQSVAFHKQAYDEAVRWKRTAEAQKAQGEMQASTAKCQRILNGEYGAMCREAAEAENQQALGALEVELKKAALKQSPTMAGEWQVDLDTWEHYSLEKKRLLVLACSLQDKLSGGSGNVRIVDKQSGTAYARCSARGEVWTNSMVASSKSVAARDELDRSIERLENWSPSSRTYTGATPLYVNEPGGYGAVVQPSAPIEMQVYVPAGSHTYHTRWCKSAKGNCSIMGVSAAKAAGLRPCATCKP